MEPDAAIIYGLGTGSRTAISIRVNITSEEYAEIMESLGLISDLSPSFHYTLVERNFQDLESVRQFTITTLALGKHIGRPDRMKLWQTLMTSTVNWLASMKMYLDYERTRLTRSYGKGSPQVNRFVAATNDAFDGRSGYRFASKFRDYVLHCGLPHSTIHIREDASKAIGASATILIDRDELLRGFAGWGKARPDIEAMDGVRDVQRTVLNLRLDEALKGLPPLVRAIETIDEWGGEGQPSVFRRTFADDRPQDVVPTAIPVEVVNQLARLIADLESNRDQVLIQLPAPGRPPVSLDPQQLRQEFERDSRGVEAILTWLAQGGPTDVFRQTVAEIIDEDGDGMPLVDGLIHLSATLAYMTAATLNTTPHALLMGLVNTYTQADSTL